MLPTAWRATDLCVTGQRATPKQSDRHEPAKPHPTSPAGQAGREQHDEQRRASMPAPPSPMGTTRARSRRRRLFMCWGGQKRLVPRLLTSLVIAGRSASAAHRLAGRLVALKTPDGAISPRDSTGRRLMIDAGFEPNWRPFGWQLRTSADAGRLRWSSAVLVQGTVCRPCGATRLAFPPTSLLARLARALRFGHDKRGGHNAQRFARAPYRLLHLSRGSPPAVCSISTVLLCVRARVDLRIVGARGTDDAAVCALI